MASVQFYKINSNELNSYTIKEGQFIFCMDTGHIYIDISDESRVMVDGIPADTVLNAESVNAIANSAVVSALNDKLNTSLKGANNGLAELDNGGKVPSSQLPSYVDDIVEGYYYDNKFYKEDTHTTEISGETDKVYVSLDTNLTYRWSGSTFVEISASLALGTTSSTAFRGDYGQSAYTHAVTNKGSAYASGLYKITTNSEGHVTAATAAVKADITSLGIVEIYEGSSVPSNNVGKNGDLYILIAE